MRQLDRLWKYQAADKKVADYETEIRQFPLQRCDLICTIQNICL